MKLVADLHCHTITSGHAYSTVLEIAKEAANKGLKMFAITDHGPSLPGGPHLYHFGNLKVIPPEIYGVEILKGVESNIIDHEGSIDMPERYLRNLDIVLAGFHTYCYPGGSVEENTRAMIGAMQHPYVDIIVHPGNPDFPIDIELVAQASRDLECFIEINNSSFTVSRRGSEDNCRKIAKCVKKHGGKVSVGSDSHIAFDVGRFDKVLSVIADAGLTESDVLNVSVDAIKKYLARKGKGQVPGPKKFPEI